MLIVEDGSGRADAESYISVAEANTYFLANGEPASWMQARDDRKETALRVATRSLNLLYYGKWSGIKASAGQALAWPRMSVYDADGFVLLTNTLPPMLKAATAALALRWLQDSTSVLGDVSVDSAAIVSESVTVGPITEQKTYQGAKNSKKSFPEIDAMVKTLTSAGGRLERS